MIPLLQLLPGLTLWLLVLAALEEPVEEHTVVVALIQPVLDGPLKAVAADTVGIAIMVMVVVVAAWGDRQAVQAAHLPKQAPVQALVEQELHTVLPVRDTQITIMLVVLAVLAEMVVMHYISQILPLGI